MSRAILSVLGNLPGEGGAVSHDKVSTSLSSNYWQSKDNRDELTFTLDKRLKRK